MAQPKISFLSLTIAFDSDVAMLPPVDLIHSTGKTRDLVVSFVPVLYFAHRQVHKKG
jgi:hypothetical protein